jgi:hypothetical protein
MGTSEILYLLGWCSFIYFLFLLVWAALFIVAREWVYKLHARWLPISHESFNNIHYALMGFFKIIWLVFFLVPYLVLRTV